MALPLVTGSNPEEATVLQGEWTKTHSNVNVGVVKHKSRDTTDLKLTYLAHGTDAPTNLTDQPTWEVTTPSLRVVDYTTARDIYVWAVDAEADIIVEA